MKTLLRVCRHFAALFIGFCIFVGVGAPGSDRALALQPAVLPCPVDMRLLVISADGNETVLPAIKETLDFLGTPYDLHIASQASTLTAAMLGAGAGECYGRYQGVILTTAELGHAIGGVWAGSALSDAEWTTLRTYLAMYKIRQASWYTFPQPQFGYASGYEINTAVTPLSASFTPEGAGIFFYLNTANPLRIANATAYLAPALGASVTPVLTDAEGHALGLVHVSADGREHLSFTFDGNQHLVHTVALGYGIVNWVTRGVFLGERRSYMSPQIDDLLIHNDQWKATTPCGTPFENTGFQHRVTASDLQALLNWQAAIQAQPTTTNIRVSMAFNGYGSRRGVYTPNDLTPFVGRARVRNAFHWINHTYTHENLDAATARTTRYELNNNIDVADDLNLPGFSVRNLVTPDVSGLRNRTFLRTAYNIGVRFVVSDTSRPGYMNPTPNTGIVNTLEPGIYMIPRYPNNLFFNVAAPDDWTAEYNCIYRQFWGRELTYQEILAVESDRLLTYLLKGDANPWMFHQTNLDAYDGTRSLLTDVLDSTLAKYNALYKFPIVSPAMEQIGRLMIQRDAYNASGVRATLNPNGSVVVSVTRRAVIPITGASTPTAEHYGGQVISHITVAPRTIVTIPGS